MRYNVKYEHKIISTKVKRDKAKKICKIYGLKLNIIDINYKNYQNYLKELDPIVILISVSNPNKSFASLRGHLLKSYPFDFTV